MGRLSIFLIFFFIACNESGKVLIIKQWHLAPGQKTKDIEAAKKLPQYENQKNIFELLERKVKAKSRVIVAEGCEGEITNGFAPVFNGWSLQDISSLKNSEDFSSIMAPVGMKVEAKYPDVKNVCGDNLKDIEENNLALSDLRGYMGFFERLKASRERPQLFEKYAKSLSESEGETIGDPVEFARKKALAALEKSKKLIEKRNHSFLAAIKENIAMNPIVVIGGIHAGHLEGLLKKNDIPFETIVPAGYSSKDLELFEMLREKLEKKTFSKKVVWFQTPEGFEPSKIPFKKLLPWEQIASPEEWENLKQIMLDARLDPKILLADHDGDEIRDFTISSRGSLIVVSAEDDDWDNDGVYNIADSSWDEYRFDVREARPKEIANFFNLKGLDPGKLLEEAGKRGIKFLEGDGMKLDLLLLKAAVDALSYTDLDQSKLRFFRLASPEVKYGDEVYFSFNQASLSIDVYYESLMERFRQIHKKAYPHNSKEEVLKGYFLPLLYHSLAHELSHAMDPGYRTLSEKDGWSFKAVKVDSKYLREKRLDRKIVMDRLEEISFKNKTVQAWKNEYLEYKKSLGKDSKTSNQWDHRLADGTVARSFLLINDLPSYYSLQKPSEWIAEKMSLCFIRLIYPDSKKDSVSFQYEQLLGINPSAVDSKFCASYFQKKI